MAFEATPIAFYDNEVIENKITDIVNSNLDVNALMTIDNSLQESAGLKKVIHKYTYEGKVEKLAKGAKNTTKGKVKAVPVEYTVERYQQTYDYNDMDVMADPFVVDVLSQGAADTMANEIRDEYFAELAKITKSHAIEGALSYTGVVDALASLGIENETGLFLIMGLDGKADVRKDAVTFFVKRAGTVEQDRDIESKQNTVVYERHGVMALTNDTKSCKVTFTA